MPNGLKDTLLLIQERSIATGQESVFIQMKDFPWFLERNGQLTNYYESGFITKPRFSDNGVEVSLTSKGKEYLRTEMNPTKPTLFISYNWGSEEIADTIQKQLKPYAEVKRDKTHIRPWGDIVEFMDSIRDQDYAVLIISDAYLRSDACLYEVMQLMKEQHWDERVMYIVTPDAHVYKPLDQIDYIQYWEKTCKDLEEALASHNAAATVELANELRKCQQIHLSIGEFMAKVKRTSNPSVDDAIAAVVSRIVELSPCESPEQVDADQEMEDASNAFEVQSETDSSSDIDDTIVLREGWNFHNDIALRLEMRARHVYGDQNRPYTKIYDADAIEFGRFAEVLIDVIRAETGREDREDVDRFIKECIPYIGMNGHEIEPKQAQKLLNKFLELTNWPHP